MQYTALRAITRGACSSERDDDGGNGCGSGETTVLALESPARVQVREAFRLRDAARTVIWVRYRLPCN